ncbi:MAG: hypothetical protein E5V40_31060 [Mesorhizobium sp.]|nr:MAG: hypothetical protein E5V40_31060 [Mesorhizobium sp.]
MPALPPADAQVAGFSGQFEHVEQGSRNNIPTHTFDVTRAEGELGFKAAISLRQGLENYHE